MTNIYNFVQFTRETLKEFQELWEENNKKENGEKNWPLEGKTLDEYHVNFIQFFDQKIEELEEIKEKRNAANKRRQKQRSCIHKFRRKDADTEVCTTCGLVATKDEEEKPIEEEGASFEALDNDDS